MRKRMTAALVTAISRPGLYGDGDTLYLRVAPGGSSYEEINVPIRRSM